ncbi:ferritin [Mollicutes bacterium LVI A0039]|nr:ferritin [Mollicutes bacterium LVI A0039]
MISKRLAEKLNDQMNFENESAHLYLAMANFCKGANLNGAESWMVAQFKEEKYHGKKIYDYLHEQGAEVTITGFETPQNTYDNLLDVLEASLAHEKKVTARINELMQIAKEENDYASEAFLQWFILEQVEEEDTLNDLIARYHLYPQPAHLLLFDKDMGLRTQS